MNFALPSRSNRRPGAPKHPSVAVVLVPASEALRHRWDSTIQHDIDEAEPQRTDYNWRWSRAGALHSGRLFPPPLETGGLPLPDVEGLASLAEWWASLALQQPRLFALVTHDGLPLAMALVCEAFVDDAHFVWLLTGLPRASLSKHFGPSEDAWPGLITLGMLWALSQRAVFNADGREPKGVLLHADVNGGQDLLNFYLAAGMSHLPRGIRLGHTRITDDRYLRFGPQEAHAFVQRHRGDFR